jgi:uroporphyrinogen decarboxylase
MNERERFIATLRFDSPDRVPLITMGPRESTLARWHSEGLPARQEWLPALLAQLGITYEAPRQPRCSLGVDFRMMPQFEEKVLEHRDGHFIVQDWMGNVTEISDEFDVTYIREARDFVTRRWHKFPVETRADFEAMKRRYNPDQPDRFPADLAARATRWRDRDYVLSAYVSGPFWQLREWCGFEPLCMLMMEDPAFIEEMATFWNDFVDTMLERLLNRVVVDHIRINEDMAYKSKSMVSPAMARRFLMPCWTRWTATAHAAGVPVVELDSDGNVDLLLPLWIESGIDVNSPMEVAAGNDIVDYRRRFGRRIAFAGGIDKRCMAAGGATLEAEMARLAPVVRDGGFIPGCDHGIPHDVSWANMLQFGRLWAEMTGWK